jgi:hypothetical protein
MHVKSAQFGEGMISIFKHSYLLLPEPGQCFFLALIIPAMALPGNCLLRHWRKRQGDVGRKDDAGHAHFSYSGKRKKRGKESFYPLSFFGKPGKVTRRKKTPGIFEEEIIL